MFKYKLALIFIILLISAGCQHSSSKTASNPYEKTLGNSQETQETISNSEIGNSTGPDRIVNTVEKTDGLKDPVKTDSISTDLETQTEKEDPKINIAPSPTAQKRIDQALELCNFAQQMWEKGKLDEALSNLDSAYFSILEVDSEVYPEFNQQKEDIRYLISKRILEIYASRQIVVNGQHNEIPIILNKYVEKEIKRFTGPERKFFIQSLERAGRLADFLEFAEIMIHDALEREESCGCHLREESQTEENEAKRDDENFSFVSVWEHKGHGEPPELHKESLQFENVTPSQRSYK